MAGNDLQFDMVMSLGKALGDIKKMQTELRDMTKVMAGAGEQSTRTQTKVTDAFKKQESAARRADEAQRKMYRDAGTSLSRLQGPLGQLSSQVGGSLGLAGSFSKVGVAAAGAALLVKGLVDMSDRAVERAGRMATAVETGMQAAKRAMAERNQAMAKEKTGQGMRAFLARGGNAGEAEALSQELGISQEDAAGGLSQTLGLGIEDWQRQQIIRGSAQAARAGFGSFSSNVGKVISSPILRGRAVTGAVGQSLIAMELAAQRGDKVAAETGYGYEGIDIDRMVRKAENSTGYADLDAMRTENRAGTSYEKTRSAAAAFVAEEYRPRLAKAQAEAEAEGGAGLLRGEVGSIPGVGVVVGGGRSKDAELRELRREMHEAMRSAMESVTLKVRDVSGGRE